MSGDRTWARRAQEMDEAAFRRVAAPAHAKPAASNATAPTAAPTRYQERFTSPYTHVCIDTYPAYGNLRRQRLSVEQLLRGETNSHALSH